FCQVCEPLTISIWRKSVERTSRRHSAGDFHQISISPVRADELLSGLEGASVAWRWNGFVPGWSGVLRCTALRMTSVGSFARIGCAAESRPHAMNNDLGKFMGRV